MSMPVTSAQAAEVTGKRTRAASFDVIIPAYNAARYLEDALESVIAQDHSDWRILLVNDGSTDATGEIAARYQQRLGSRMCVITQANAGLPAARNSALRVATANFLAILDADDVWLPCRLRESLAALEANPTAGLSYGLIERIDEEGEILSTFGGNLAFAEGNIAPAIYMRKVELPCPTVTLRRSALADVGEFDETMRATEDRDFWLRIALRHKVAFIPQVIAQYRMSASSMSTDIDRMMQAQFRFIEKHFGAPGCGRVARRVARARVWKQRGEVLSERGQRWPAVKSALHACSVWPFGAENLRSAVSLLYRSVHAR